MQITNVKLTMATATELTLASDAITVTQSNHKLQPQTGTSDNLSTISGTSAGDCGILYVSDFGTDTITIKHNVGNILCVGSMDIPLSNGCVFWYSNGTKVFVAGGSDVTSSNTVTLTNKRVTRRAPAVTQAAEPAINTDITDVAHITGLAQAITSMTTNLTGTPVEGDMLRIDITDNGTARAITWGAKFEASTIALPTTTVLGVRLDVVFVWNTATTKWRCVGVA